jgi:predicted nucleic acid-binding protein
MALLIDTNVIIDALQGREGFLEDASEVILRVGDYDGYITANSVTDIFYLQKKYFRNEEKARKNLKDLLEIFEVLDVREEDCRKALRNGMKDFEDAVLVEVAMRSGIDIIVKRNKKDFRGVSIRVCTPREFPKIIK